MTRMGVALVGLSIGVVTMAHQQANGQGFAGTAVLGGIVVDDQPSPVFVRRARVIISDARSSFSRTTTTADDGRFIFEALPPGRFMISAMKGGYVRGVFGASHPDGPGVAVVLADGQRKADLRLTMFRGGVITGAVRGRDGVPLRNVAVRALRRSVQDGVAAFRPVAYAAAGVTDDRGLYRIYGLPSGAYLVSVEPPVLTGDATIRPTTAADLAWTRQVIQLRGAGTSTLQPPAGTVPIPTASPVSYAESYYPATASIAEAVIVHLKPGDERGGIDIQRLLVPTARLTGTLVPWAGQPLTNVRIWMRPVSPGASQSSPIRANADGTFVATRVMPGEYLIGAEAPLRPLGVSFVQGSRGGGTSHRLWARLEVVVNGIDQTGLTLTFQSPMRVAGHVEFEGLKGQSPNASGVRVSLKETGEAVWYTVPTAASRSDGSFAIENVAAGQYHMVVEPPAGWLLKSIRGATVDYADGPIEIRPGVDVSDLAIVFTTRITEIAGTLQDSAGHPASSYTIVVFSADPSFWTQRSRRVLATRPADDGQFTVKGLPAGNYLIAALTDVEDGQWFDHAFLQSLVIGAAKVTVVDGERTVQNLQIRK